MQPTRRDSLIATLESVRRRAVAAGLVAPGNRLAAEELRRILPRGFAASDEEAIALGVDFTGEDPAAAPVDAWPGTPEKLAALAARYKAGESLWHPGDRQLGRMNVAPEETPNEEPRPCDRMSEDVRAAKIVRCKECRTNSWELAGVLRTKEGAIRFAVIRCRECGVVRNSCCHDAIEMALAAGCEKDEADEEEDVFAVIDR